MDKELQEEMNKAVEHAKILNGVDSSIDLALKMVYIKGREDGLRWSAEDGRKRMAGNV